MTVKILTQIICDKCGRTEANEQLRGQAGLSNTRQVAELRGGWRVHKSGGVPSSSRTGKDYCANCVDPRGNQ